MTDCLLGWKLMLVKMFSSFTSWLIPKIVKQDNMIIILKKMFAILRKILRLNILLFKLVYLHFMALQHISGHI